MPPIHSNRYCNYSDVQKTKLTYLRDKKMKKWLLFCISLIAFNSMNLAHAQPSEFHPMGALPPTTTSAAQAPVFLFS
jgi:hypothetical protein